MVAGTASGVGKTTIATGLMAALTQKGLKVGAAKVGPDFIDPGYHALATGRPGRNLDSWICGEDAILPLAGRAGAGADVLIVEGVMGLFDGAAGDGPEASTASVATLLQAPVLLVVDASSMSRSVAAVVHGFASYDPSLRLAGIVLNRVGSPGHAELLREAIEPLSLPVLGVVHRDDQLTWRDRHLGLVPVAEQPEAVRISLGRLAEIVTRSIDLDAVLALARTAPTTSADPPLLPEPVELGRSSVTVAVAAGPAFSFVYRDNLEALEAAGADLAPFDPLSDERLPEGTTGIYAGGGFPEVYASRLSDNRSLLADLRSVTASGVPVWAECGGLLWLARSLEGAELAGVIPAQGRMTDRLTLGYRRARARTDTLLAPTGTDLRGHEFHYSQLEPPGDALELTGRLGGGRAGYASADLFASYLHLHLGGNPTPAARFVSRAAAVGLRGPS